VSDGNFIDLLHEARETSVASLIAERRRLIEAGQEPDVMRRSLPEGKLLLFYPDLSLFEGAAEAASRGFFDSDNVPAWDTWVYCGTDGSGSKRNSDEAFLVTWIPREFVPLVNAGIDVNPEECFQWSTKVTRNFTRSLKQAGILI